MPINDRDLDAASRLGSTRKRKRSKADRRAQTAAASKSHTVANTSTILNSESDTDDNYKENDIPPELDINDAEAQELERKAERFRKKTGYWKNKAKQLKEEMEEKAKEAKVREKEDTKRHNEEMKKDQEREKKNRKRELKQESQLKRKDKRLRQLENKLEREAKRRKLQSKEHAAQYAQIKDKLHENQRQIHALKSKVGRIPSRLSTVLNRATHTYKTKAEEHRTFYLKENGIIPDEARNIFLDLVAVDEVPANKVTHVFQRIADAFGILVKGNVDRRSVGRIVKEGGNASKLQIGQAVLDAKGVTISSDGTTHKNETYETKHATVIQADNRLQFFLGLQMAINHTSETQLEGWIDTVEDIFHLLFQSGMCAEDDARIFWNLVTGFHSDHAADQKKLFGLMRKWKERCDRSQLLIENIGGPAAWEALTVPERATQLEAMKHQIIRDMGEAEYTKLSETEKAEVDFFLWAGCCMHKEMNVFKGGCVGFDEFWKAHPELDPPKLLPNRDNAAAISKAAGTEAAERAFERSEQGAIKGGQQDTLQFFFDHKLGFNIAFPDTSNTRFQSHAEASAVIVTYLDLFIEFLTYVKLNKGSEKLNHMEQNVLDGLLCMSTRHKFVVITLHWLGISVPYMREICGPYAQHSNILMLGPLHQRVIDHIDALIAHPEYLIGPDASAEKGSLDGRPWERPEAFYASQRYAPSLPHLKSMLIDFLKNAKVVWLRFSSEFEPEGALATATAEQIERAWMEKTNDLNEAAFGMFRQTAKGNPTMTLAQYNAQKMYKLNQTSEFLRRLSPEMHQFLRKITRTQDASGSSRRQHIQLAEHRQNVAEARTEKQAARAEKRAATVRDIDVIVPILTITELDFRVSKAAQSDGYFTVADITKQLKWHKVHGVKGAIPMVETQWGTRREDKIKILRAAIDMFVDSQASNVPTEVDPNKDEPDPEVTVQDLEDFDSNGYDSEADYYK
ncbi:hypothetical protein BDP27DRAFT_1440481 [Rhodocollybia butyracea]|uniref:Uncharacterized protein n=1 Tax=Rhodocollybia butyracea TaxID=206335 RepID=A0A9P5P5M8_9AGAR|nr:hypothetical protein BDP27DRAFT_1440481 [Rhodocollybia butyracea]